MNTRLAFARCQPPGLLALFGFLSPALAMALGAALGALIAGSDAASALGAMAGFVLANGSMSSNQSGDCPARSASPPRRGARRNQTRCR